MSSDLAPTAAPSPTPPGQVSAIVSFEARGPRNSGPFPGLSLRTPVDLAQQHEEPHTAPTARPKRKSAAPSAATNVTATCDSTETSLGMGHSTRQVSEISRRDGHEVGGTAARMKATRAPSVTIHWSSEATRSRGEPPPMSSRLRGLCLKLRARAVLSD